MALSAGLAVTELEYDTGEQVLQDYLDELVWEQVMGLLKAPELVRAEIDRRMEESLSTDPMRQRKIRLERELKRTGSS